MLANLPPEQQSQEIDGCRRLAEELGQTMTCFSYSVGTRQAFTGDTSKRRARAGVRYAFSSFGGFQRPDQADDFDLPRLSIARFMNQDGFRATVTLPEAFGRAR